MLFISKQIIKLGQVFLWLYSRDLVKRRLTVSIEKDQITETSRPRIVISNHVSHHDPFVFIGTLSWKEMRALRPMRPMLAKWYYYSPLLPIAYLIGCYPTRPILPFMKRYAGTNAAIRYGKSGCTLGIYPEGMRIKGGRVTPKYGVIKILEALGESEVYLIHIDQDSENHKNYSIRIKRDDDIAKVRDPQLIMDKIFSLTHNDI